MKRILSRPDRLGPRRILLPERLFLPPEHPLLHEDRELLPFGPSRCRRRCANQLLAETGCRRHKTGYRRHKTGLQAHETGYRHHKTGLQAHKTGYRHSKTGLQNHTTRLQRHSQQPIVST